LTGHSKKDQDFVIAANCSGRRDAALLNKNAELPFTPLKRMEFKKISPHLTTSRKKKSGGQPQPYLRR